MNALFVLAVNIFIGLSGLVLGVYARRDPKYFWRYLIIGCLATTPLALGGFTWYEELFAGFYLLANLPTRKVKLNRLSHLVFVLFIAYMVFESFRGIINFIELGTLEDSIRKLRWPIFFLILFGLFYKINDAKARAMVDTDLAYKITLFGSIYYIIYILWGVFALVKGGSVAYTQNAMINYADVYGYAPSVFMAIWTPTAYVSSLLPIVVAAVLITLLERSQKRRIVAWFTLFLIGNSVFFYDTRSGSLCVFALILIFAKRLGIRRIAVTCILGLLFIISIIAVADIGGEKRVEDYFGDLKRTMMLEEDDKYDSKRQDIDRKVWMYSAYPALTANLFNFFFGYGFRTSGYVVAPYVYEMFALYGIEKAYTENVSTEAITNIAVDSGTIGLALVLCLFLLSGLSLYKEGGKNRILLIASLGLTFGWLFAINIVDSFLLYLIIMPSGILTQLGKLDPSGQVTCN